MVNFRNKTQASRPSKPTNPIEIYETLDRKSVTGPLRPVQISILNNWFETKVNERDLIIKLHTGEGKTLIGLLILLSKINKTGLPSLYLCPNNYLVQQVCQEANKFGIPYSVISEDRELPSEFVNGEKMLITNTKKLFNGRSKFGLNNNSLIIDNIILDDSHACIESIISSFTIKIPNTHSVFFKIVALFEEELKNQGEGSFLDMQAGNFDSALPIPYWAWIDKKSEITFILSESKDDIEITFVWPLIKDHIDRCQAFLSGQFLEISPYFVPIDIFGTFSKASQRILMSATTQDDSFFIKGLNFSVEAVRNPLTSNEQLWSGEKMILLPSLIKEDLDRDLIITHFGKEGERTHGIVAITPSNKKSEPYKNRGSKIATSENIFSLINGLKNSQYSSTIVFVNRYDGIDLPDESCRILIIDSLPYFNSLYEKYEELCLGKSDIVNIKLAQKIEQGLGRSVRGEKDYTVILMVGADIIRFVKSIHTNKYFSEQTKRQLEIGLEVAFMAQEDLTQRDSISVLFSLINQCLKRDEGWKDYYREEMNKIELSKPRVDLFERLSIERECERLFFIGDNVSAYNVLNSFYKSSNLTTEEEGWYYQMMARIKYTTNKIDSNIHQTDAFKINLHLLKPKEGINYLKIELINDNRLQNIFKYTRNYPSSEEFSLSIHSFLDDLTFGVESEKFENALYEIGKLLGFISQRPDKEIRKGPDNLWGGIEGRYFLFECKNEVDSNRDEISKREAGQMNSHCAWFESEYGQSLVKRILIIPTKNLSYYGDFTHEVFILRKNKLRLFKDRIKSFMRDLSYYQFLEISDLKLQEILNANSLGIDNLWNDYCEPYYKRTFIEKR